MPADEARSVIASALRKTLSDHGTALLQDLGLGFGHEQSQAEREVMEFQRQVLDRLTATSTPDGGTPHIVTTGSGGSGDVRVTAGVEGVAPVEISDYALKGDALSLERDIITATNHALTAVEAELESRIQANSIDGGPPLGASPHRHPHPPANGVLSTDSHGFEPHTWTRAAARVEAASPAGVLEVWDSLDQTEQVELLKLLVEEYCREHGIDPPPEILVFDPKEGEEGMLGYWDGDKIHINARNSSGPIAMNIVIHEAQHAVQTEIHRDYEALSPQERQDMKDGRIPDTFAEHGSSIEEAERLAEADPHYNPKSSRYGEAPKEIDARQAVYEWSDDLTEEKMKEYVDRVRE